LGAFGDVAESGLHCGNSYQCTFPLPSHFSAS
jgi:hypothetical protein